MAEGRASLVARGEGRDRREVAARGVAPDRDPIRVRSDLASVRGEPSHGRDAVVDGGRERMLGPHAVVDRHHRAPRFAAEVARHRIMGVEAADDVPAAVEPGEPRRGGARPVRVAVDADRDRTRRPRNRPVLDRGDGRGREHREARPHPRLELLARRLGGELLDGRQPRFGHLPEEGLDLGMHVVGDHPSAPGADGGDRVAGSDGTKSRLSMQAAPDRGPCIAGTRGAACSPVPNGRGERSRGRS